MLFLLGVRFRAPARRGPPGAGRGPSRGRAPPGPAASKRLQAAPRQRTPAPPKTAEIIPHPTRRTATPPPPTRGRRTARPHIRTAPPVESATAALRGRSDAPPRAPRTPVPETARGRAAPPARAAPARWLRGASLGRLGGPRLCVCVDRGAGSDCAGARAVPAAAPAPRERGRTRAEAAGPVSYFQPARALGDFRVGYHTA